MKQLERTVGLVTFDFPPGYRRGDVAARPTAAGSPLSAFLRQHGVTVINPAEDLAARDPGAAGGIRDASDLAFCVDALKAGRVDCLLIDCFHWARLPLVSQLVREMDVPTGFFANTGDGWNGVPMATAASGSIREQPHSLAAALVERFVDTHRDELIGWITGAGALSRLRRSRLMCWGGSYGAEMPYTRSDPAALERLLVAEIMTEQEVVLLDRARAILSDGKPRIERFSAWLSSHGAPVRFDGKMLTQGAYDFQVALYLAARDRLDELARDEPPGAPGICGASIKCHYELSISPQGCTACLLPAFLPFGEDAEGPRRAVPVACEGDLNGLATLALLHTINPAVPPLFGDLAVYRDDHILLRNCGASSVYWAARSTDSAASLARVSLEPTIHGRSGCSVHYETPAGGPVTFARLFRSGPEFLMFLGEAHVAEETETTRYSDPWPHTRLSFNSDPHLFYKATPCNHGSITEGSCAAEVEVLCAHAGIRVVRCDDDASLSRYLAERAKS